MSRAPPGSADWGGPGRSPRDTRLGRAAVGAGCTPGSTRACPPALHLARLSSARLLCACGGPTVRTRGDPLCARGGPIARRGRSGAPGPQRPRPSLSRPAPLFPRAGAQGHIRLCACKLCFSNRLWGASLVGNRVFSLRLPSVTCRRLFLRGAGSPRFVCQQ